ncbi:MAG: type I methionyl aminopeptidase [Patescibacteria group bacterium]
MAITIKKPEELEVLREAGKRLGSVLRAVAFAAKPGVTPSVLDALAERLIREGGDLPAFKNYKPDGAKIAFPSTLCVSVNNAVVHGIPGEVPLAEGDVVGLDLGLIHKGLFVDAAVTVPIGKVDEKAEKLISRTREALALGIAAARGGGKVGDIGAAVEQYINQFGYGIVRELAGHGVGYKVHEEPFVPNYGLAGTGPKLVPGMVLAIEPMVNEGGDEVRLAPDKFTFVTTDGSRSAHFEHTIIITEGAPEVITK